MTRQFTEDDNFERYECATCCYATNSYDMFLQHGKEHAAAVSHVKPRLLAERIVDRIFKNLDESTWGETFHAAKEDLKDYREDMIEDAEEEIVKANR